MECDVRVVAFKSAVECRPGLTDVFVVQAYWRDRDRLMRGKFQQFFSMETALRAAIAQKRAPAVLVYRVRGSVEADYWEEPVTLARLGQERDLLPR